MLFSEKCFSPNYLVSKNRIFHLTWTRNFFQRIIKESSLHCVEHFIYFKKPNNHFQLEFPLVLRTLISFNVLVQTTGTTVLFCVLRCFEIIYYFFGSVSKRARERKNKDKVIRIRELWEWKFFFRLFISILNDLTIEHLVSIW